ITVVSLYLAALSLGAPAGGENTARPAETAEKSQSAVAGTPTMAPALAKVAAMVGGTWVNIPPDPQKPFPIEFRYEMALGGRAVRAVGVIGKGTPMETPAEAFFGWDPQNKCVYYIDFHGAETIYKGTVRS
ncbi:MAG TPA: hypothetical protein VGR43_05810, partial [Dehalococcoidia bacterium]|nr:hypothetical protein [Dehalococcoidia bacterium]